MDGVLGAHCEDVNHKKSHGVVDEYKTGDEEIAKAKASIAHLPEAAGGPGLLLLDGLLHRTLLLCRPSDTAYNSLAIHS